MCVVGEMTVKWIAQALVDANRGRARKSSRLNMFSRERLRARFD
jgi:hypothetical protein